MSVEIMGQVWTHSKHVGAARLCLLAIADCANDNGGAFPGIDEIAKKARVQKRHVYTLVDKLCASGELVAFNRARDDGGFTSNAYVVVVGCDKEQAASRVQRAKRDIKGIIAWRDIQESAAPSAPRDTTQCTAVHPPSAPQDTTLVHSSAPESFNEPSIEPSYVDTEGSAGKKPDPKPDSKPRPRDPFFDAICDVCDLDPEHLPPDTKGSAIGKVKKDLVAAKWQAEDVERYHAWRQEKNKGPLGSIHWLIGEMAKKDWRGMKAGENQATVSDWIGQ